MPRKSKTAVLDSTPSYGVAVYEDARARLKHQILMQDYQELHKEVDVMRSKLEAGKLRKMMLAAEVRFLRRRYEHFMKMKIVNSSKRGKPALKQAKHMKEFGRKEANQHTLPAILEAKPKKKKQYISKEVAPQQSLALIPDSNHKVRIDTRKKSMRNATPVLDLNQKERLHANDTALRNTFVPFDLNMDDSCGKEKASLPNRAGRIFDLNEISTGDEDFHNNVEEANYEEGKRSLMRHPNDEVQNELMLSICRNAGEGPSRVGKRKISWQDPVALRV